MKFLLNLKFHSTKNALKSLLSIPSCSLSTTPNKIVLLSINNENGIAKISLNRPPVNSIVPEIFNGIAEAVEDAEEHKCKGIILTSVKIK